MRPASRDRFRALAVALAVVAASGCTERRTAERADSDLSHDLALANQISAQPALKDTVVAPAPQAAQPPAAAPRPERTNPGPQPVERT
ncbi:MAG: hypothetical protein KGN74_01060, partial [Gemmatimonadota bacterium]|nr:hypothetical protein [Gemmatimonadota bacterium]